MIASMNLILLIVPVSNVMMTWCLYKQQREHSSLLATFANLSSHHRSQTIKVEKKKKIIYKQHTSTLVRSYQFCLQHALPGNLKLQ